MFYCFQDIGLLHSSLLSASSNSGKLFDCDDIKEAVNIVYKFVKNIIHYNLNSIKDDKEAVKGQLEINERLHAAVFFTTLRSYGIKSSAADTFYNSIVYSWPSIGFKFYVELNFMCDWSEYFIKCATQLPSEVLYSVLKIIVDIPFSNKIKSYSWHLIMQAIILKFFEVPCDPIKSYPFDFDFTFKKDSTENEADAKVTENSDMDSSQDISNTKPLFKEMFLDVCKCLSVKIKESNDEELIKILFHTVRMALKILILEKERNFENASEFVNFLKIYDLLNGYLLTDVNKGVVKTVLENCPCVVVYHAYSTNSWNISLDYLAFLIDYYSIEVLKDSYLELKDQNEIVYKEMIDTPIYAIIKNLNSPFLQGSSSKLDQRLEMLHKIIQLDFNGSSFAAETILKSDPSILERNNTIMVLKENHHVINIHQYHLIIHSIKEVKSGESKLQLLMILYKLLQENDIEMYDNVLDYILSHCGFTEVFQLPDFEDNFAQFRRKTPSLQEAEKTLPALFVQSPLTILKYLIDQALVQGSEGRVFVQVLKHFPKACLYSKKCETTLLSDVLNQYFEKNMLEAYESKNMVTLYKFLAEVQAEKPILCLDYLLECCIIPKLQPDYDRIYLILECLHMLLPTLGNGLITLKFEAISSLIFSLGRIIAHCIDTGNGKLKSFVIPVIKELEMHLKMKDEEKEDFWLSRFQGLNEMVYVYVKEFLPSDIKFSSTSFVWTWCCKNENANSFEETFSCHTLTYPVLLNTLIEVLPHLTKEEWLYSSELMKICCKNQILRNEILHFFNLFHLSEDELNTYSIISCFTTSLHFILNGDRVCDPLYISSCFSNCLINLLNQEENLSTPMLIAVFLDVCHLIECILPDLIQIFTVILFELKKYMINSCSKKNNKKACEQFICKAVECLPNSSEKVILLQKLSA